VFAPACGRARLDLQHDGKSRDNAVRSAGSNRSTCDRGRRSTAD
jgi:hypothetical protein